ncbi:MAG: hypothetical protein HQL46_13765, partial [Gammaproteobacteria bacterium]|nr:hypothetical protein [Gammaproteobacteria bacterium]
MTQEFPLVIVGGSAGSLKPIQDLFSVIESSCGAAFIVIQHMSPDHESHLDQLIAKRTIMPVEKLMDGMKPLPNQVLINLPGKFPVLQDTFHYISPDNTHRPIDRLCESLPPKIAENTILVILSGNGNDGKKGAAVIKKCLGKIIVQDPGTAAFTGMPQSIIDEELSDLILSPDKIGEVLSFIDNEEQLHKYLTENHSKQADLLEFEKILLLVKDIANQDMSAYKPSTLKRRIQRRMGLYHYDTFAQYHKLLLKDFKELEQLSKDLLIGVTTFFRDSEAFKILKEQVIPELCRNQDQQPSIRVWIAGCSTGEEAYSIAILLIQHYSMHKKPPNIQIFATDIDNAALEVARTGVYTKEALSQLAPELVTASFIEDKGSYRINKQIRESIVFASHNLITDPPFSKLDLVVCRNLLIYLNSINQKKILSLFHFVLNENGYLFLGSSENIGNIGRHFNAISKQWRIYHHTNTAPRRPPILPINVGMSTVKDGQSALAGNRFGIGQEHYYNQIIQSYGPVHLLINKQHQLLYVSGPAEQYISIPVGQASHDIFKIARTSLSASLRSAINQAESENRRIAN